MSTSILHTNRNNRSNVVSALLAGYKKYFAKNAKALFEAVPQTPKEIEDLLVACVEANKAVVPVRAALQAALKDEEKAEAAAANVISHIRQLALLVYGSSPEVLAEFGLGQRKPRKLQKLEDRLAAKEKRKATRKARHTMGRKQRAAITGDTVPAQNASSDPAVIPPTPITPPAPTVAKPATNGAPVPSGANGGG